MMKVVRPAIASSSASLIWRSVEESTDEVASSRISMRGSASSAPGGHVEVDVRQHGAPDPPPPRRRAGAGRVAAAGAAVARRRVGRAELVDVLVAQRHVAELDVAVTGRELGRTGRRLQARLAV